jgi:hypothetical protein
VLTYLVVGEEAKRGVRALKAQSELFEPQAGTTSAPHLLNGWCCSRNEETRLKKLDPPVLYPLSCLCFTVGIVVVVLDSWSIRSCLRSSCCATPEASAGATPHEESTMG